MARRFRLQRQNRHPAPFEQRPRLAVLGVDQNSVGAKLRERF
ncbi:hypothetical protein PSQ19_13685 [Devosia algicola]|uniref:Uncharacterized protein n=1 Tax=Devosia algicola TaxID=3026418 RepID=A0ABY7YKE7_9HYPH|nr:hypothetical protein [Devosia algicola]WDR01778.1 hypothetical protein PSQ19_13685 [Devosia algicola]